MRLGLIVALVGSAAGCGRLAFDPLTDANNDSGFGGGGNTHVTVPSSDPGDELGFTVAVSGDGNTFAATAIHESSAATGIDGNEADNSAADAGAVFVFARQAGAWTKQAYIKASNTDAGDLFGQMIALSADGNTLAVGAYLEDSSATGIDGNQADNTAMDAGAVYIFTRTGQTWTQQAYLKASNTDAGDYFGVKLALSADGNTLLVGAVYEGSGATGVGGNQTDDSVTMAGAAYVFVRNGTTWSQEAYIKATNTGASDDFGDSLCISPDGTTIAVASYAEDSSATGVGGNMADNLSIDSGAVYVYTRVGATWSAQAYLKASNTGAGDHFGNRICSLSSDGNTLSIGASEENSSGTGVNSNSQGDDSSGDAGAVYIFTRAGTTWTQQAYIKAINTDAGDLFGFQNALSANGDVLFVDSPLEAGGNATDPADNSAPSAGAAYVYSRAAGVWTYRKYVKSISNEANNEFGFSLATSASGQLLVAGVPGQQGSRGAIDVFE